jgi:hypothetical protein
VSMAHWKWPYHWILSNISIWAQVLAKEHNQENSG